MELVFLIIGFLVISFIVSLDVIGLTIAKSRYYAENEKELPGWAALNGFWHALLLASYAIGITGFINFFQLNLDFIADILSRFDDLFILRRISDVNLFVKEHFSIIAGIVALIIIWQTYHEKIISEPGQATRNNLGFLAKLIFDIFESIIRVVFGRKLSQDRIRQLLRANIEAALVAVDMLALAILANQLKMLEKIENIAIFSAVVFLIVSVLCFLSGKWAVKYFSQKPKKIKIRVNSESNGDPKHITVDSDFLTKQWWLVTLRLLEPWLIFYFALELMSVLLYDEQTHSPGYIFGTTIMLYSIIRSVGLNKIIRAAVSDHSPEQVPSGVREADRKGFDIFLSIIGSLVVAVIGIILFTIAVGLIFSIMFEWYDFAFDERKPALDSVVLFGGFSATLCSIIVQFVNDDVKYRVARFLDWIEENYYGFFFSVSAIVIAITVPIFDKVASGKISANNSDLGVNGSVSLYELIDYPVHAIQIVATLLWLLSLSFIIPKLRPRRLSGVNDGNEIDCSWNEIVMKHDKGNVIFFPLLIIAVSMFVMIFINQAIFNSYCSEPVGMSQRSTVCAG